MKKILLTSAFALGIATMLTVPSRADTYFPIIAKGFSHQFWQAVKAGAEEAAARDGVPTPSNPEMSRFWSAMKTYPHVLGNDAGFVRNFYQTLVDACEAFQASTGSHVHDVVIAEWRQKLTELK